MLRCWPLIILLASWLWGVWLWFRLADHQTHHPGEPYVWNWKYLNPNNFTAEGRPLLRRLWLATGVFAVAGVLAVIFRC